MARPTKGYFIDGEKVPSVTTVISRFKESGGLIHWAWQCGMDGLDYREVRNEAAAAGTLVHRLVEAWVRNQGEPIFGNDGTIQILPFADPGEGRMRVASLLYSKGDTEMVRRVQNSFDAFIEWASQSGLKVTETECSLVSREHRFAGTLDAITLGGRRALCDWKSSKSIYADYMLQLAAYGILWDENFPERKIDGGYHLMRFDKETAGFSHHYWPDLSLAARAFLKMRDLYDDMQKLGRAVA